MHSLFGCVSPPHWKNVFSRNPEHSAKSPACLAATVLSRLLPVILLPYSTDVGKLARRPSERLSLADGGDDADGACSACQRHPDACNTIHLHNYPRFSIFLSAQWPVNMYTETC